ncbi:MAG: hypothetical protein MUF54_05410 [Polyangiaceae bacterium]|nr:hypothetical protein [Polyangiaceae bacterium]
MPNAGPPAPVTDSLPPGLTPLTDAEAEEAESKCAGLSKALAEAVRADKSGRGRVEVILEALQRGVTAPGVDAPRCADLIRRDLLIYRARMIESEAINNIKMISLGLASASSADPRTVCPSAGPTPPDLAALQRAPVGAPATAWRTPGWSCVRFQPQAPLRFQYELRTDPSAMTYEIVARGFPVAGQPAIELFQQGRAENGAFQPSSDVLRR